ncbi:MAG TPA: ATP-dependent Clp protease proteolytic subunit [bacterium]|nr:ATP-dependent Clp protease proteolytic subunit [bacterium]HPO07904.1 ATP-dependent Clp protease proteolytic subunit [bacterium]HQO33826.1 ATP-dependent Clp protease proteolytic subunit [bacterium]HQP99720.1 ATP-dependent Clp protease proteolytic subunit [bacterium]
MSCKEDEQKNGEEKKEGTAALSNRLLESRTIVLSGEINQDVAHHTISQLLVLAHDSDKDIRMFVQSQGGHVDSGFAIHDVMRFIKPRVVTLALGWVASMGVPIFLGGAEGCRYCLPHTRFMLHQPSQGVLGQASDIEIEAKEILRIRQRINELLANATKQPIERIEKDSDRNFWMNADQAKEYGLVDKIVQSIDDIG